MNVSQGAPDPAKAVHILGVRINGVVTELLGGTLDEAVEGIRGRSPDRDFLSRASLWPGANRARDLLAALV